MLALSSHFTSVRTAQPFRSSDAAYAFHAATARTACGAQEEGLSLPIRPGREALQTTAHVAERMARQPHRLPVAADRQR